MQIEQMSVGDLANYENNSRTHSDDQVSQICASITEFGFTNPVLIDNDNIIIAGHGRLMAAKKLNLKHVPCIRLGHLNDEQRRAYVIADNQLALNAGWDLDALRFEVEQLSENDFNIELLGFDDGFLSTLTGGIDDSNATGNEYGDTVLDIGEGKYQEQHGVIIVCSSESEQENVFNKLSGMGYNCRVVST